MIRAHRSIVQSKHQSAQIRNFLDMDNYSKLWQSTLYLSGSNNNGYNEYILLA